jgi:hypothetical protein
MVVFPAPRGREFFTGTATAQFIMLQNERGLRDFQGNSTGWPEKLDRLLRRVSECAHGKNPIPSNTWQPT